MSIPVNQLKQILQARIPSKTVESVQVNRSLNDEETVYVIRVSGKSPVMIRSKKLEDVMELKGPSGALQYIIDQIA